MVQLTEHATETCESCTAPTDGGDLEPVRRVYYDEELLPDVQLEIERWCTGCRDTYPHEAAGGGEASDAH